MKNWLMDGLERTVPSEEFDLDAVGNLAIVELREAIGRANAEAGGPFAL